MEENISSIEEYRKRRRKKKRKKKLLAFLVLVALVLMIGFIWFFFLREDLSGSGGNDPDAPIDTASMDTGITANGYPIAVGGSNPIDMKRCGQNIVLLTKNSVIIFNGRGEQVYTGHHGYSKPTLSTSSKRVLTYDQGGYQFRVDSNKSRMGNKKLTEKIIYGVISNAGYTGIVTQTERYTIKLTVYDPSLNEVLSWNVSDQVITGIDFHENSTACIVTTYSVEKGIANSKAYELGLKTDQPERFQTVLPGCMAISVNYLSNGNISVVGDQKAYTLSGSGEIKAEWEYVGALSHFENESKEGTTLFLKDTGNTRSTLLWRIDPSGNKLATGSISSGVTDAYLEGDKLMVLTDRQLLKLDHQLKQIGVAELTGVPLRVIGIGNVGYVLTAGKLEQVVPS